MPIMSYAKAIRRAIDEELERDDAVFVMGQDVGAFGGVFGVTKGLQAKYGKHRVFDTPISENFLVGGGVGAALTGTRPVVELQYADFIEVAMDEVYNKAAKWRYMHGGLFTVPLVIRAPEGAANGAGPEHSQCPEGLLLSAAGLHVVTPATPADALGLLKSAIRSDNPVVFLEHKGLYGLKGEVPDGEHLVPIGVANTVRPGRDVTVVAWTSMVHRATAAAEQLAAEGVEVEVIDPRGVRPLDTETILASVRRTGRLVVGSEAPAAGGAANEVAALVAEAAIEYLAAPVTRVCGKDIPLPQSADLEQLAIPTTDDFVAACRRAMG
ncbi:alpha-ketoacid dehydrogenase subunit beta [Verrucosispora sp. WMMC514]|uniref:alpha-ketoacid dehydrogenase subunit beta n=1 Tax=Verrucosispora sp. WMMC514 TaxID=3015156 RepID=UPI00248AE284|nr:alpha-ketoacid dehydrogenase subunit beta [Verrucosispora sp. WMMC514]WBB89873.1 alpha-ketoacid dehydrogenase subunit beta [Verrucosispora sp. WMMC514]